MKTSKPLKRYSSKHLLYLFIDNVFMVIGIYYISVNQWLKGILLLGLSFIIFANITYKLVEVNKI